MADQNIIHPGPLSPSLLTKQSVHVSEHVWAHPNYDRDLRARRCRDGRGEGHQLLKYEIPQQIVPYLKASGFYYVSLVADMKPNHKLIEALVERWRPETHTFHLPVGEATITLQDVAIQLGLRVDGKVVSGKTKDNWQDRAEQLLGMWPLDYDMRGSKVRMTWLNQNFANVASFVGSEASLMRFTRAYILRLLGGFLLADSTGSHVSLRYLNLLDPFEETSHYSWGSAVLAQLYQSLCKSTKHDAAEVNGCNLLIQLWAYDRIRDIGLLGRPDFPAGVPLDARWTAEFKWQRYLVTVYRRKLDMLEEGDFVWESYTNDEIIRHLPNPCVADADLWRGL